MKRRLRKSPTSSEITVNACHDVIEVKDMSTSVSRETVMSSHLTRDVAVDVALAVKSTASSRAS